MVAEMPPIEKRTSAGTPAAMNTTCFQSTSRSIPSVGEAIFMTHPPRDRADARTSPAIVSGKR